MLENNQNQNLMLIEDLGMMYPTEKSTIKSKFGLYKCFCGKQFKAIVCNVNKGGTNSCGCAKNKRNSKHGYRKHRLYNTWHNMMDRCNNPKDKAYKDYGARGITVCERWHDIKNFIEDVYPTYIEGLTIDRINVNGNYEPNNYRWENRTIQNRNTRILRHDNKSGYRGVSWNNKLKKWASYITVDKKQTHLGIFEDAKYAAMKRDEYVINNKLEHTLNFN